MPGATAPAAPPPVTAMPVRGPSARGLLKMHWDYPVYVAPEKAAPGLTASKGVRRALSREEAIKYIAGSDPRPLLVLRECMVCNGTDDALLKPGTDNEPTFLLATWFHCVKLPVDANEPDHPFRSLFVKDVPEHLFVCSVDGSNHDPLESQTSRAELWQSMRKLVALEYQEKPESALKRIAKVLDKMDAADQRWNELVARRDALLEEEGPDARKLPKVQKELEQLERERQQLAAQAALAARLELKRRENASSPP